VEAIPEPVRRFVDECIESVGLLEVLLLLKSDSARAWTAAEVSREVRSDDAWTEIQLEYLGSHGLLVADRSGDPAYRYNPLRPELDVVVEQLGHAFETHRVRVIRLIFHGRSNEPLRAFSDAFRLRGDLMAEARRPPT
jgi:hypothetical protein